MHGDKVSCYYLPINYHYMLLKYYIYTNKNLSLKNYYLSTHGGLKYMMGHFGLVECKCILGLH